MFDELSGKLELIFKKLRGQGKLTEANLKDALRDIRRALLEGDVNFKVAKRFLKNVEIKALGEEVISSVTPAQMIVKIVQDELIEILGGKVENLNIKGSSEVILICGLQGSGKTTSVAKLAKYLTKLGKKPLVSSVDVHRPAAIEQLRVLAEKNKIEHFGIKGEINPITISKGALDKLKNHENDLLIMDTAGRLHVDDEMMDELSRVVKVLKPDHIIFVADGMTGQDAVNAVQGFMNYVEFDGVILTKMDGDARGGAALSIKEVTGKPLLFVGNGESVDAFEQFHPDRLASRILGMGDIVSLVEKAQDVIDEKKAKKLQEKIMSEGLSIADFLDQLQQLKKMGPLNQIMEMIPGMGKALKGMDFNDNSKMDQIESIILSMTVEERHNPHIIDGSRRKRISKGSGTSLQDVNNVMKQFFAMQKMMKKMSKMTGPMNMFQNIKLPM
ncbi:signal recognition particle protein [Candidatus Latescibacterota bacterium]